MDIVLTVLGETGIVLIDGIVFIILIVDFTIHSTAQDLEIFTALDFMVALSLEEGSTEEIDSSAAEVASSVEAVLVEGQLSIAHLLSTEEIPTIR